MDGARFTRLHELPCWRTSRPAPNAVIEVRELGGVIDGVQMWVPGTPVFVPGQELVLCLERAGGAPTASGEERWRTVAMEFSAFRVDPRGDGDAMLTRDVASSTVIGAPAERRPFAPSVGIPARGGVGEGREPGASGRRARD